MAKIPVESKKILKELSNQLKNLQSELTEAKKQEGIDENISVKIKANQARFELVKKTGVNNRPIGHFYIDVNITAKSSFVYIPLSIASGKKPTGFIYQIEGTAAGKIKTATVKVRGEGVSQLTVGTLLYAKIPPGVTATFILQATIEGKAGKAYKLLITRINYKLAVSDPRYKQYEKTLVSDGVRFS